MAKSTWAPFPHPDKAFDYAGDKLAKAWPKLHAGDQETFPDEKHVAKLLKANSKLGKDAGKIAAQLQEAWRAFHRGDFHDAYEAGLALKALGASVAIKAAGSGPPPCSPCFCNESASERRRKPRRGEPLRAADRRSLRSLVRGTHPQKQ